MFHNNSHNSIIMLSLIMIQHNRAVKMGWNPRANPTHHGFGPGWVEK